jgi:hypothetical protein
MIDPSDKEAVERARAEIQRRYSEKQERTLRLNRIAAKRIKDIERYLAGRYGRVVPDDDAGREDLVILLNHLAQNPVDPQAKMRAAVHSWAPSMDHDEMLALVEMIAKKPRRYRAKTLGRLMRITVQEHATWELESIWAHTTTEEDMKAKELNRERDRKRTKRRRKGMVPREEYLAANCKSRAEPWKALQVSRAKYYRMLKAGEIPNETSPYETSPSAPLERDSYRADTPVPSPASATKKREDITMHRTNDAPAKAPKAPPTTVRPIPTKVVHSIRVAFMTPTPPGRTAVAQGPVMVR